MTFGGKGVSVEGDEWVFALLLLQGMVKGQETREVFGVGDETGPDYMAVSD